MSLVSIAGGATGTGTFTVLAPSTNTNRTLTLPDATGTVLDSTGGTTQTALTVTNGASIQGLTVGRGAGAGSTNTVVGASALIANTTGYGNTSIGRSALSSNTTGNNNTAVGPTNAVDVGAALAANTTGSANIAIGGGALNANTTASNNTAVGYQSLYDNTTGAANVAVGYASLANNTTAEKNVAVGVEAMETNTTGQFNTAVGCQALRLGTTASNNTAVGFGAGYSVTTGQGNAFIGSQGSTGAFGAGYYITTGSNNTIIGAYTGNQGGLDIRILNNHIVLSDGDGNPRGYFNNSGHFHINNTSTRSGVSIFYTAQDVLNIHSDQAAGNSTSLIAGWHSATSSTAGTLAINVTTNGNVTNTNNSYGSISDVKLKENIVDAKPKLDKLMQVRIVNYNLKADLGYESHKQIGVIAQELEQVFPSLVDEHPDRDQDGKDLGTTTKSVKMSVFVPMLIKAIQELKAEFDAYKATHP